jgi:hypothetical protein
MTVVTKVQSGRFHRYERNCTVFNIICAPAAAAGPFDLYLDSNKSVVSWSC